MAKGSRNWRTQWMLFGNGQQQRRMLRLGVVMLTPVLAFMAAALLCALTSLILSCVIWWCIGCPSLWAQSAQPAVDQQVSVSSSPFYSVIQQDTSLSLTGTQVTGRLIIPDEYWREMKSDNKSPHQVLLIGKARCWNSHGRYIVQILWSHIRLASSDSSAKSQLLQRPIANAFMVKRCALAKGTQLKLKADPQVLQQNVVKVLESPKAKESKAKTSTAKSEESEPYSNNLIPLQILSRDRRVNKEETDSMKLEQFLHPPTTMTQKDPLHFHMTPQKLTSSIAPSGDSANITPASQSSQKSPAAQLRKGKIAHSNFAKTQFNLPDIQAVFRPAATSGDNSNVTPAFKSRQNNPAAQPKKNKVAHSNFAQNQFNSPDVPAPSGPAATSGDNSNVIPAFKSRQNNPAAQPKKNKAANFNFAQNQFNSPDIPAPSGPAAEKPELIPDPIPVEVEVTTDGCPPRIDESHDRVIIQTRSISRQNGQIIHQTDCSDTNDVFPINKDYQCPNCQDDVRLQTRKAFARYQKYWIDEQGQRQYLNDRLYVDETSPYPLTEQRGDCPFEIDWHTEQAYPQVEAVYTDRTHNKKQVQGCHRQMGQPAIPIAWTMQDCQLIHDFPNNQSQEQQRAFFNVQGVEHQARSCRPRGNPTPHEFVTSVCDPIRDIDGRKLITMARRRVKTSLGPQFVSPECEPHGPAVNLQATVQGCEGEYVHDWPAGKTYLKKRWYHTLRGQREYVTSCLRNNEFLPHQRQVVEFVHNDQHKTAKAKTVIYIEANGKRLEVAHPQVREDEEALPYIYIEDRSKYFPHKAIQEGCYLVTPRVTYEVYHRPDNSELEVVKQAELPLRHYNCQESWEYKTAVQSVYGRLGSSGYSSGNWTKAFSPDLRERGCKGVHQVSSLQYKRKVITYPNGGIHSRGNWVVAED